MEPVSSYEMKVPIYESTWRRFSEYCHY